MKAIQMFNVGDRVAERPKSTIIPNLKSESLEKIQKYRSQRFGVVVDVFVRTTISRGNKQTKQKFLRILWDGMKTPSDHAQMRICHEAEFGAVMESYGSSIGA